MKKTTIFAVLVCLCANLSAQNRSNLFFYDASNLLEHYAPLHLGYERRLTARVSLQMELGSFKTKKLDLLPDFRITRIEENDGFLGIFGFDLLLGLLTAATSEPRPEVGTIESSFNHRGAYFFFGPKFYFKSGQSKVRRGHPV
jgi:hypothetical protein